ncbi:MULTISPECIES: hypothetical protein [unclassified Streptomyces]|uniref:hypothetical protein n=1 Tax=unclassified Streptomyces TaxID=2593676 RepID=UPI0036FBE841
MACVAAIAGTLFYLAGHAGDKERRVPAGGGLTVVVSEPGVSETVLTLSAMGMLLCAVTAITLVIVYIRGRAYRRTGSRAQPLRGRAFF